MLHEIKTETDFEIALEETNDFPTFLNVHFSILFQKFNRFPEVEWRSFWFQNSDGEKIYIVVRIYKDAPSRSFLLFCSKLSSNFDKDTLWNIFDEIVSLVPQIFRGCKTAEVPIFKLEGHATIAYGFISDTYKEWYSNRFSSMDLKDFPCHYYFMTKEQQQMLVKDYENVKIPLPQGYFFDKTDVEKDAQVILNTWRHAAPGDFETTKAKIRRLPSSLVREEKTKAAIAFELVDSTGFMNHLFTLPEHRNKGIGAAVEIDLCLKLIKERIVPFKDVETFNKSVLAASEKSKYWTRWNSAKDEPILVIFHKHVLKTPN